MYGFIASRHDVIVEVCNSDRIINLVFGLQFALQHTYLDSLQLYFSAENFCYGLLFR